MTTRAQLRTMLRERLEDTMGSPLWSDAALNEFLAGAVRVYGARFPTPATALTAAVEAGATSVALPAGAPESGIVAVRDARGRDVAKGTERLGPAAADARGLIQGWRVWAGTLRLQRAASGDEIGAWAIDFLAGRELVGDEVTAQPIEAGDEPIVVALAAAQAMARRAIEDAKRGARRSAAEGPAAAFRTEAEGLMAGRKRRVRGGYVSAA